MKRLILAFVFLSLTTINGQGILRHNTIYVDTEVGSDSNNGSSWSSSIKTMRKAISIVGRGGTINFYGEISEDGLVTPQGITDVTIVGAGTKPRHGNVGINSGPKGGASQWGRANNNSGLPLLKITQQGWVFKNIEFSPASRSGALYFIRNISGDSSPAGFSGDHATIDGCAFSLGQYAILQEGGINRLRIVNNTFYNIKGPAIASNGTSVGYILMWEVKNNYFIGNDVDIQAPLNDSDIVGNTFHPDSILNDNSSRTRPAINLMSGKFNIIQGNYFGWTRNNSAKFLNAGSSPHLGGNLYSE